MKGQSFINSNSLKLVENTLVKCRIPLSSKIGVEFFCQKFTTNVARSLYIVKTVQNFRIVQVNLSLLEKK